MAPLPQRARSDDAKDARRQAMLEAAMEEFYERGFAAARMEDIAGRAGVSKGTLYLYFDNKDALFLGLIETIAVPRVAMLEAMVEGTDSLLGGLKGLVDWAPSVIRETSLPRLLKIMIGESGRFPGAIQAYRARVVKRGLGAISRALKRAHEKGEISVEDPDLTARLVVAPMVLSLIWEMLFRSEDEPEVDLKSLFRIHARTLLKGLGADMQEVSI